ncbi:unnamed protein product [Ilex paraguariensis]|uniref:Non-structural maintenance of chromosomes element 1 homolog n=1 Tax=Ilex paraguariensis TaxID=185542 RepID=A0ABC8U1K0_9AQUA
MPTLCWRHHTLIQALLSRGPLKEEEFHSIFSYVTGKSSAAHLPLFKDYLLKINRELSSVQFELRACRNQYNGDVYYGIVNNVADEQSKLGTNYTVPQIAFYKGILSNGDVMVDELERGGYWYVRWLSSISSSAFATGGVFALLMGGFCIQYLKRED